MKSAKDDTVKLDFHKVDLDTMSEPLKAKWQALKKIREQERLVRDEFEQAFLIAARKAERVEKNLSLVFSYKWGGMSVAKVDRAAEKESKASSKPKFSF